MRRSKNNTGCTMSDGYVLVHESDSKLRKVVRVKSDEQIEEERKEAERLRDISQLLRAGEGDLRPVFTKRTP